MCLMAANMIRDAEQRGVLGVGKKLVEAPLDNTGLGLAMTGNVFWSPLQTPLSAKISLQQ